ncbi:hypothetical protein LP415_23940 [Polaromonas sp. P1(28)-8]|nr:hypothetical protein LP415_23940 [Polaromonas sp. P1(28)-8]
MPQNHSLHPPAVTLRTISLSQWLLGVGLASLLLRLWISTTFPDQR